MELIADILLAAGALGAGFYCFVLARRLNRFNDLEKGVGGAVAVLSAQVDDLSKTLVAARSASDGSTAALDDLTTRAESVAQRLELMMASMHDIPGVQPQAQPAQAAMQANGHAAAAAQAAQATPAAQAAQAAQPAQAAAAGAPAQRAGTGPIFVRHGRGADGGRP